ncbi:leucine-rich repeat extensin-like protein 2 [Drosophila eugracilis]|uniref:leucine-rich repeat extensin-like protein 2 n=1 Tax=Drosophila eugracilis TaxID=29029 RepID=UPI001BD94D68|nr:leucine-rich repeat extensin-like protein 2 [Drosophila eugracilis]
MLHSGYESWTLSLLVMAFVLSTAAQNRGVSSRIAIPGEPHYYLRADAGPLVTPNESLKRTNRSLLKWWDDLFPRNNNCCPNNVVYPPAPAVPVPAVTNNCNGLQLQDLDPFKQIKLFKKLPELFPSPNQCGQCAGSCGQPVQPQINYAEPQSPSFGGDSNGALPNPGYDGPGDGDAGYVAPPVPSYEALAPAVDYSPPAPSAPTYDSPASYTKPEVPSEEYGKTPEYNQGAQTNYAGAQPAQIVYQPIIYVSTPLALKSATQVEADDQRYISPTAPSSPPPASVYDSTQPSYYQPAVPDPPSTPNYATPSCQTPIRLSLIDQPYRVAPELFEEYNYRLALASQNIL